MLEAAEDHLPSTGVSPEAPKTPDRSIPASQPRLPFKSSPHSPTLGRKIPALSTPDPSQSPTTHTSPGAPKTSASSVPESHARLLLISSDHSDVEPR
jgi:hypothetical protein